MNLFSQNSFYDTWISVYLLYNRLFLFLLFLRIHIQKWYFNFLKNRQKRTRRVYFLKTVFTILEYRYIYITYYLFPFLPFLLYTHLQMMFQFLKKLVEKKHDEYLFRSLLEQVLLRTSAHSSILKEPRIIGRKRRGIFPKAATNHLVFSRFIINVPNYEQSKRRQKQITRRGDNAKKNLSPCFPVQPLHAGRGQGEEGQFSTLPAQAATFPCFFNAVK